MRTIRLVAKVMGFQQCVAPIILVPVPEKCPTTNNDCEGWHRKLNGNKLDRNDQPFYQLIAVLYSKTELADMQALFLADNKLRCIKRKIKPHKSSKDYEIVGYICD